MTNALQICYYPVRHVIAGGQIRVSELAGLITGLGYERHFLGIYPHRADGWPTDFPISSTANNWVFRVPYDFEMRLSDAILVDRRFHNSLLAQAEALEPSLLWFEHPFLWPVFRDWANRRRARTKIVYSSHNVEWAMKKEMLERQQLVDDHCIQRLYATEQDLLFSADVVLCCSDDDRDIYRRHGRPDAVVVPNGSACPELPVHADEKELSRFRKKFSSTKYILAFISSWHEPNWFGLRDLVLPHMRAGGLLQSAILVLMGDICKLYEAWCVSMGEQIPGVICVGRVTEAEKSAIFKLADIVVLPITAGGGTNLKTAEALLSKRVVVATDVAFRGFERHLSRQGIFCGSSDQFSEVLGDALQFLDKAGSRTAAEMYCAQRLEYVVDCCWPQIVGGAQEKMRPLLFKQAS